MPDAVVVIPCYDEAARLSVAGIRCILDHPRVSLWLVDDGSTDETAELLEEVMAGAPERGKVIHLGANRGKANAVRAGMLDAIAAGAQYVGYADADLATPPEELARLLDILVERPAQAVVAARVALHGTEIHRRATRHYLGRAFATAASLALGIRIYDTQCGAKWFYVGPALRSALAAPFTSRWAFDVELLGRMLRSGHMEPGELVEVPLREWRDPGGSKLGPLAMAGAVVDLARIARNLRRG